MATATKKASVPPASTGSPGDSAPRSSLDGLMRAIDAVYRFLASLKLAVISLCSLAAALAVGTFFERSYGTPAAQDYVYQSTWFAVLLAFLATNILCAALIRFPWKRRQTGFVITHLGLLVLIFGSYFSFKTADEGMVVLLEGDSRASWCAGNARDPRPGGRPPYAGGRGLVRPGLQARAVPLGEGQAHLHGMLDLVLSSLSGGSSRALANGRDAQPAGRSLQAGGKAASPLLDCRGAPSARPLGRADGQLQLEFKAPGMPQAREAFATADDQWFKLDRRFYRLAKTEGAGPSPSPTSIGPS